MVPVSNLRSESTSERSRSVPALKQRVAEPVRVVGFWLSIALPFLYLPLLATGLNTGAQTTVFLSLLAINLLALWVGRTHRVE